MDDAERKRIREEAKAHLDDSWTPERFPQRSPPVEKSAGGETIYSQPLLTAPNGHGDVVGVPVEPTARVRFATEYVGDDEPGEEAALNRWLRDNLNHERGIIYTVIGEELEEREHEHAEQIRALELKLKHLEGQVDLVTKQLGKGRRR